MSSPTRAKKGVSIDDLSLGSALDDESSGPELRRFSFDAESEKSTEASTNSSQGTDFATERREHPSFSDAQVAQIVRDHAAAGKGDKR
jgi:hypothetical protein